MTPKQAERLRKKITDIRRVLAAEKRKFGAFDDSRGARYFPTRYYVQLGDFKGGLTYLRWFHKNFPDDAGFPDFLFEWVVILFKNGKLKDAEQKAIQTFCANIHLLDSFLGRPGRPLEPWEYAPLGEDSLAPYFDSLGKRTTLLDFAEWLAAFVATPRFSSCASQYLDLRRQLHGEHDLEKRRHLVAQLRQIAHAPWQGICARSSSFPAPISLPMKATLLCLLTLFLLNAAASYGQDLEPIEVAKQIFDKTTYATSKRYSIGEYQGHPNGQDLPPAATTRFLLLGQDNERAVVALTIQGEAGQTIDTYLHFRKDTIWKLSAFRALAMTGMIAQAKKELEQMTPAQVDQLIASSAAKKYKKAEMITSRADYDFELGNFSLVLESDDRLVEHFRKHQAEFARLRDLALAEIPRAGLAEFRGTPVAAAQQAAYRKLFISSIHAEHAEGGKRLNFLIGGILDNSVGYFYVTDKRAVPVMSPGDVIMIREIGDGWYLYKTT